MARHKSFKQLVKDNLMQLAMMEVKLNDKPTAERLRNKQPKEIVDDAADLKCVKTFELFRDQYDISGAFF